MKLIGKVCLVSGGSRGIGKKIVEKLSYEGANVYFTYVNKKDNAIKLKEELNEKGFKCTSMQMEVTDRDSVKHIIKKIKENENCLDILINNAGINYPTDFDKIEDKDWDKVLNVNLKGPFILCQESLVLLKKSASSSIINIGSVSGQYGGPRTAHYAASKAGLISLGQVVARFGAEYGIRCNTLSAGLIASDMADEGLKSSAVREASKNILMKRFGTKSEVANVVVFLASEDSNYITGQTINVNGGLYF